MSIPSGFDKALRETSTVAAATALLLEHCRPYEVDTLAAGEIDLADTSIVVFFAIAWPQQWLEFYRRARLHEHDPVVNCIGHYRAPFTWNDMRRDRLFTGLTTEAFDRARDQGWTDGLVVPIARGGSRYGLVSLVARRGDFLPEAVGDLSLMSIAFHQHVRVLAQSEGFPAPPAGLSERERECLQLVARGLSDKQIAEKLGIGEVTARSYFEGARRKLKTDTRAQTAARAASWGIVSD